MINAVADESNIFCQVQKEHNGKKMRWQFMNDALWIISVNWEESLLWCENESY